MKSTTTYLHFNGNCRTAMAFYRECFGGELEVMAYPNASGTPNTDPKAPVQHSMIAHGGQSLIMASRANAAMSGRDFVTPDDVKAMALPVLEHRLILRPEFEIEEIGRAHV